jgi:2-polyprenyl-3-methyl-5-hydroxy-6-metoxy-1,4-benzoquinol methylase
MNMEKKKKVKYYDDINLGVLKNIDSSLRVLDVGCGTGLLGSEIKKKGNFVFGIDFSRQELALASKKLDKVKLTDITSRTLSLPKNFDTIVFADVLEHLKDPSSCLKTFRNHLTKGGTIIVSLPNIACYNMRLNLFFGNFTYRPYGILDDTHLRFFTKKTARKLIQESGYTILKIDTTPYIARPLIRMFKSLISSGENEREQNLRLLNSTSYSFYRKFIFPMENLLTKIWPGLFAYQFIFVARK